MIDLYEIQIQKKKNDEADLDRTDHTDGLLYDVFFHRARLH